MLLNSKFFSWVNLIHLALLPCVRRRLRCVCNLSGWVRRGRQAASFTLFARYLSHFIFSIEVVEKRQSHRDSWLVSMLSFSLPLQVRGPLAHTEQEDVPCLQTTGHSEKPRAVRVRVWGWQWRTWWGGGFRRWGGLWTHPPAASLQPRLPIHQPRGLFIHHHHHHHHCPVPGFPCTLGVPNPGLWRLPLPRGGLGLGLDRRGRREAPLWRRHGTTHQPRRSDLKTGGESGPQRFFFYPNKDLFMFWGVLLSHCTLNSLGCVLCHTFYSIIAEGVSVEAHPSL